MTVCVSLPRGDDDHGGIRGYVSNHHHRAPGGGAHHVGWYRGHRAAHHPDWLEFRRGVTQKSGGGTQGEEAAGGKRAGSGGDAHRGDAEGVDDDGFQGKNVDSRPIRPIPILSPHRPRAAAAAVLTRRQGLSIHARVFP